MENEAPDALNRDLLLNSSNNIRFKKFEPRAENENNLNDGLNFTDDFSFNPTKFYCPKSRTYELEFVCSVTGNFYCKKC